MAETPAKAPAPAKVEPEIKLTKLQQAAILLMSIGEVDAATVLKHMGPKEVQRVGMAMAGLATVQQKEVEIVLKNFVDQVSTLTGLGIGNDGYIRKMLVSALGEDRANSVVDRILMGGNTTGIDTLKWMEPRAVSELIRNEHPQIQTLVIAYLDADQSAEILAHLPEKMRIEIMIRVATLDNVQPGALQELNDILEKQFSGNAGTQTKAMGGYKVAAEIMNQLDSSLEEALMTAIKETDDDLGNKISDLMFVFENLKGVDDKGIQVILREVSSDVLILALKGSDDEMKEKVFKNMSKRAGELLRDDMETRGPVRVSEVEAAQKEILNTARRLANAGEIMLGGNSDAML